MQSTIADKVSQKRNSPFSLDTNCQHDALAPKRDMKKMYFPFLQKGHVSPSIKPLTSTESKVTVYIKKWILWSNTALLILNYLGLKDPSSGFVYVLLDRT